MGNNPQSGKNAATGCGCVILILICLGVIGQCIKGRKSDDAGKPPENASDAEMVAKWVGQDVGQDPHGFATAGDMYKTAPTRPFDDSAVDLIRMIDKDIENGTPMEAPPVWSRLQTLNPYRQSPDVLESALRWSKQAAASVRKSHEPKGTPVTADVNQPYRAGDFKGASARYISILQQDPWCLDARNNLGLSEVHQGNDLIALIEFQVLAELNPKYLPAAVNLTVAFERAGLTDAARDLALRAAEPAKQVPPVAYNAAWFHNMSGNYKQSSDLLDALPVKEINKKHKDLREMSQKQAGGLKAP